MGLPLTLTILPNSSVTVCSWASTRCLRASAPSRVGATPASFIDAFIFASSSPSSLRNVFAVSLASVRTSSSTVLSLRSASNCRSWSFFSTIWAFNSCRYSGDTSRAFSSSASRASASDLTFSSSASISPRAIDRWPARPAAPNGAPTSPAPYAASPYSANASSVVRGSPACRRSSICWVISVGISTAAPTAAPFAKTFFRLSWATASVASVAPRLKYSSAAGPSSFPTIDLPNGTKVDAASSAAPGIAAAAAAPREISGAPSAACLSILEPNNCNSDGATAPRPPPINVPTPGSTAVPAIAPNLAEPRVAAMLGACSARAVGI